MTRIACLAALTLLTTGVVSGRQDRSFRASTDLVSVFATVTDGRHRLVSDLDRADFRVFDNGREQTVTYFSNELQPFSVVLMLDRSGSMAASADLVRQAALTFVGQLRPGDRARIGTFSREILIQPASFSSSPEELGRILRSDLPDLGPSPVWAAIDQAVTSVAGEPGRRVVLVLTDGHDDPPRDQPEMRQDDVLDRARFSDVMVYAIGFAGERQTVVRRPRRTLPPGPVPWPGRRGPAIPLPRAPGWSGQWKKEVQPPDPGLKRLADESGGGYFELDASEDLTETFARVAEELHRQYWLGFTPAALDGRIHRIEIRTARPGLQVRARRSYVATPRDVTAPLNR